MKKKEDVIWQIICREAQSEAKKEPVLASFFYNTILNHESLENALSYHLAGKLQNDNLQATSLMELFMDVMKNDKTIQKSIRKDIAAVKERDPASKFYSQPLLYFKGFHALQSYRIAHRLWEQGRASLALILQSRISEVFGVDIHPGATIGHGVMIDHATSIVIGETATLGNNVSMLHSVTLGGTGKAGGIRHPQVGNGVLIGAGAKLLGKIYIGDGVKIGAGSVVLTDIPAHSTAVGVPAKIVGKTDAETPAYSMDHKLTKEIMAQLSNDYSVFIENKK
ncbi:MAG: serine O-acetyltransferase [Spirochaetales bacterium]|nr:serine O-acetyltransferase [Spirochaetales bacterium]